MSRWSLLYCESLLIKKFKIQNEKSENPITGIFYLFIFNFEFPSTAPAYNNDPLSGCIFYLFIFNFEFPFTAPAYNNDPSPGYMLQPQHHYPNHKW